MKSQIIHVICSPHGGIATYVLGAIEARSNKNESIYLFSNHDKSDLSFEVIRKFLPFVFGISTRVISGGSSKSKL